jgi:hypothetical protein
VGFYWQRRSIGIENRYSMHLFESFPHKQQAGHELPYETMLLEFYLNACRTCLPFNWDHMLVNQEI